MWKGAFLQPPEAWEVACAMLKPNSFNFRLCRVNPRNSFVIGQFTSYDYRRERPPTVCRWLAWGDWPFFQLLSSAPTQRPTAVGSSGCRTNFRKSSGWRASLHVVHPGRPSSRERRALRQRPRGRDLTTVFPRERRDGAPNSTAWNASGHSPVPARFGVWANELGAVSCPRRHQGIAA